MKLPENPGHIVAPGVTLSTRPRRIQRRRVKGWRMPEGAVYVGRGTRWGNPFRVGKTQMRSPRLDGQPGWEYEGRLCKTSGERHAFHHGDGQVTWHDIRDATAQECVDLYREWVTARPVLLDWSPQGMVAEIRECLAGRDLACWCPLDAPCHADVLLDVANERGAW